MNTKTQDFDLPSDDELSDNQLDAASGGEINIIGSVGKCVAGAMSDGGGGNGLAAFYAGFLHGLTH